LDPVKRACQRQMKAYPHRPLYPMTRCSRYHHLQKSRWNLDSLCKISTFNVMQCPKQQLRRCHLLEEDFAHIRLGTLHGSSSPLQCIEPVSVEPN